VLVRRPPITEVTQPPEIAASVPGVLLDRKTVERYAQMCGFGATAALPVTFPHVLAMPLHLKIFANGAFPLRPMGLIHLSNVIESLGELAAGARVDITVAARNYQRTDAGLAFDMATEISSAGRPLWCETCVFLSRWPEDVARQGSRPARPPKAPKDSAVLAELDVSLRTAWDYARVSADFNPIHLSDRLARRLGLRGAIVHGLWSLARSVATEPAFRPAPGLRLDTQFLSPVQLPARVTLKEWQESGVLRRALCDTRTGRVHMYAGLHAPTGEGTA
jgi:acyl dehydratase